MKLVIEISEEDYELVQQGHIPFCVLDVIKNGTPLPKAKEYGFIAVCDSEYPLTEKVKQDIKDTIFVGNEECSYCFEILEIIPADKEDKE